MIIIIIIMMTVHFTIMAWLKIMISIITIIIIGMLVSLARRVLFSPFEQL